MANQVQANFRLNFLGDGASTTLVVDLLQSPLEFYLQTDTNADPLLGAFNPFGSRVALPVSITAAVGGIGSTTAVVDGNRVTFTFSSAPSAAAHTIIATATF